MSSSPALCRPAEEEDSEDSELVIDSAALQADPVLGALGLADEYASAAAAQEAYAALTGNNGEEGEFVRPAVFHPGWAPIHMAWVGFADDQSGIAMVEWAVGTCGGCSDLLPWSTEGLTSEATSGSGFTATLWEYPEVSSNGTLMFVSLRVTNGLGLSTTVASAPAIVDATPAISSPVYGPEDRYGEELTVVTTPRSWRTRWGEFYDETSGIAGYVASLYRCSVFSCNIEHSTRIAGPVLKRRERSHTFTGLQLEDGAMYFTVVTAVNGAGLQTSA